MLTGLIGGSVQAIRSRNRQPVSPGVPGNEHWLLADKYFER